MFINIMDEHSAVGIEMGYELHGRGSIPGRAKDFLLLHSVNTGSETHPASYTMGIGGPSPEVKRQGRETDHSSPSGTEVKNGGVNTSTPPHVFMAWCLIN
jgi:hypothetical protein